MSQKWFQLKCTELCRVILFLSLSLIPSPESLGGPAPKNSFPPLLTEVEARYAKAVTLSADFVQENENLLLSQMKKSSGKILVKRPSKIRWETLKPDPNLLVSNGKTFWFYTPPFDEGERGQVVQKSSTQVQSQLAHALLSGSFSLVREMTIQQKTPASFILTPRSGTAGTVAKVTIEVDPEKKLIQKILLEHQGGNHSEISLSNIELGRNLNDDLFVFKTPPNTDQIEN